MKIEDLKIGGIYRFKDSDDSFVRYLGIADNFIHMEFEYVKRNEDNEFVSRDCFIMFLDKLDILNLIEV